MIASLVYLGHEWFWTSHRFETEQQAKEAFKTLEGVYQALDGIGFYRHGTTELPGIFITAVGLVRDPVKQVDDICGQRTHCYQDEATIESLIARRIRFVADLEERGAPDGGYVIRRGTRGAIINPDGSVDEQIGHG